MNCQETARVLDAFFDGELDGRLMRDAALHVTRCAACEQEFVARERIHDLLSAAVGREIAGVEPDAVWRGVERALEAEGGRAGSRLRRWSTLREGRRTTSARAARSASRLAGAPAMAGAALAAAVVLVVVFVGGAPQGERGVVARRGAVEVAGTSPGEKGAPVEPLASRVPAAPYRGRLVGAPAAPSDVARDVFALAGAEERARAASLASPRPSPLLRSVAAERPRRQVEIESLDSRTRATAMWSAPASDTAVIWIGESAPALRGGR